MLKYGNCRENKRNWKDAHSRDIRLAAMLMILVLAVSTVLGGCGGASATGEGMDATEPAVTEGTEEILVTETESVTDVPETESITGTVTEEVTEEASEITATEMVEETEAAETEDTGTENGNSDGSAVYTFTDMDKTMYAKKAVNVRDLPSTDGNAIGSLAKGDAVTVTGQCNETGWYRFDYNGQTGYSSNNYFSTSKPSSSSTGSGSSSTSSGTSSKGSSSGSSSGKSSSSSGSSSGSTSTKTYDPADYTKEIAEKVIEYTNKERKAAGVDPLEEADVLMDAAAIRAEELITSFSHTRPDGTSYNTVLDELTSYFGKLTVGNTGENALLTGGGEGGYESKASMIDTYAQAIVNQWMNSDGHRENMLNPEHKYIGVCVYDPNKVLYATQLFADDITYYCASNKHTWGEDVSSNPTTSDDGYTFQTIKYCTMCSAELSSDGDVFVQGVRMGIYKQN